MGQLVSAGAAAGTRLARELGSGTAVGIWVAGRVLGWKTSLPSWADRYEGYTKNYSLFGRTYSYLNVIVENSAMASDGNGETYIFSKPFGIVRSSTYSAWTSQGYGWDLIPEN